MGLPPSVIEHGKLMPSEFAEWTNGQLTKMVPSAEWTRRVAQAVTQRLKALRFAQRRSHAREISYLVYDVPSPASLFMCG